GPLVARMARLLIRRSNNRLLAVVGARRRVEWAGTTGLPARRGGAQMTQGEAILQGVLDNPDDDTPRLVYADWLDDHGDPDRAEFIRVQIELARLAPGQDVDARLAYVEGGHEIDFKPDRLRSGADSGRAGRPG